MAPKLTAKSLIVKDYRVARGMEVKKVLANQKVQYNVCHKFLLIQITIIADY